MWTRSYDNCRTYSTLQANKLLRSNNEQYMFVYGVNGAKNYFPLTIDTSNSNGRYCVPLAGAWSAALYSAIANYQLCFEIGTGDTPETYDDYTLAAICGTSKVTKMSQTLVVDNTVFNPETGKYTTTVKMDFKNITSGDLVIKEYGVFARPNTAATLIYRKVLDEPVTLASQNYYTVSFTYESGYYSDARRQADNADLLDVSWDDFIADIKDESKSIEDLRALYPVGKMLPITYTWKGVECYSRVRIDGYEHTFKDVAMTQKTRVSMSFDGFVPVAGEKMNDSNTNAGGWGDSKMRRTLNDEGGLFDALPHNIKEAIVPVNNKYTKGTSSAIVNIMTEKGEGDKLYLYCLEEMGYGKPGNYIAGQGTMLEYFDGKTNIQKARWRPGAESPDYGWSRSSSANGSSYFWYWFSGGVSYNNGATYAFGICPGFSL